MKQEKEPAAEELPEFLEEQEREEEKPEKKAWRDALPKGREIFPRFCYFPVICLFSELVLRLCVYRGFPGGTMAAALSALAFGCVWNLMTLCFPAWLNRAFHYLGLVAVALYSSCLLYTSPSPRDS